MGMTRWIIGCRDSLEQLNCFAYFGKNHREFCHGPRPVVSATVIRGLKPSFLEEGLANFRLGRKAKSQPDTAAYRPPSVVWRSKFVVASGKFTTTLTLNA